MGCTFPFVNEVNPIFPIYIHVYSRSIESIGMEQPILFHVSFLLFSTRGEYRLVTCAPKPGQRLKREEIDSQGTFLLKDQDDGRCLSALSGNVLGLSECTAKQRWRVLAANGFHQVQHCESKLCIDAGSEQKPILELQMISFFVLVFVHELVKKPLKLGPHENADSCKQEGNELSSNVLTTSSQTL